LNKKISDKDLKDWKDFLSNKESLPDKDQSFTKKEKIKKYTFDLHGFSLEDANKKIEDLINKSYEIGVRKLVVITGKGLHSENEKDPYVSKEFGKLKYSVPDYVRKKSELMSKINNIEDADIEDGGSGAFYINLKKKL
tara:strand:- start:654 stop:1067 length:414 start_codon:yes stop_codon:yes gene_type:complete